MTMTCDKCKNPSKSERVITIAEKDICLDCWKSFKEFFLKWIDEK